MNGTYAFVFSGGASVAIGFFTVQGQQITGADCGGGRYDGTIVEDPASGNLRLIFDHFAPGGIIADRAKLPLIRSRAVALTMPPGFGGGEPIELSVPPDTVTMMVKRVADRWAGYCAGFSLWPQQHESREAETGARQIFNRRLN